MEMFTQCYYNPGSVQLVYFYKDSQLRVASEKTGFLRDAETFQTVGTLPVGANGFFTIRYTLTVGAGAECNGFNQK